MKLKRKNDTLYIQVNARWRELATISSNYLFMKRDSIENFVRKYNGYGFNYDIMLDDRWEDTLILVETDYNVKNVYHIPRLKIVQLGVVDQSSKLDRQVYLSKTLLKKFYYRTYDLTNESGILNIP